ncbi:hypothetical protein Sste5346_002499 [Sporothrix stenoceras]|uniref:Phd and ring finger domain protein n=1 Tax=Sporothrix stenoceras TaxID=5173 RepID=A0ABR3ZIG3_9PEZI
MAEQCIVCLEQLRSVEPPPLPPPQTLPEDSGIPPDNANASTSTPIDHIDDSVTAPSSNDTNGPSTAAGPASSGLNGQKSCSDDADKTDRDAQKSDVGFSISKDLANGDYSEQVETLEDDRVAVIQICKHTLHDTCLREWTTKANSCPICRQSFHLVDVYDQIGGKLLSTYTVEDKKQVVEFDPQPWLEETEILDDEVSTPCPVCNLADHEEVLLLCDGCDTPYHTHCIGLEGVPEGAWFCMECVDSLGDALAPMQNASLAGSDPIRQTAGRTSGANRARNFFPRTRHTMRRARRRARSDEWQGAWSQITGHVWDAINIDLDHDEDEALEEFRRVERLRDQERREFERWQERLDIARRLGAQDIFERNIPNAILNHAARHGGSSQSSSSNPRAIVAAVQQSQQERRAWGDFDRAIESETTATTTPNTRKRKSRSHTASPIEQPQEQERKLKRPRTRRIGAPSEGVASSSKPPTSAGTPATPTERTLVRRPSASRPSSSSRPPSRPSSRQGLSLQAPVPARPTRLSVSPGLAAQSPATTSTNTNDEVPSFLSSLLKEVEMSTSSDDDNIRTLFGDPPSHAVDPGSPVASSPAASAYNSPRAMSTTPPPQRTLRPSSPTLLSSHILPVYPPANYSPTRSTANSPSNAGVGSGGENSDSEGSGHTRLRGRPRANGTGKGNPTSPNATSPSASPNINGPAHQQRSPTAPAPLEIRQPRPRRMSSAAAISRSLDSSPTRHALPLEMKESISSIVRSALKPHWKSSHLTADQYAVINRDVSRKLYEEVADPAIVDTEARKLWEQKANREVERAVADLQA